MQKKGHGIYEWQEGHSYEGEWVDGKRHGTGTQKWQDGSSYEGEWENDKRHGHGVQLQSDGSSYEGEWENDKRHGMGTEKCSDGSSYMGQWKDGKRHGNGVYTRESCICDCVWENDLEISGVATWPDGRVYKGTWKNKHVGVGTLTYPDGDVFHVDSEAGIYVLEGETCVIPNISIYHTFDEPVPGLGSYDGAIWSQFQHEMGLDNLYDLVLHFFDLEQEPDDLIRFFEQVVSHDVAVSCTEFIVERWGKHTIPDGMNRYDYLKQFTKCKPPPLVHTHSVTFHNGTSCVYKTRLLSRLPNALLCLDQDQNKVDWSCSICMSDIPETHDIKRTWLECGHSFHNVCVFDWFYHQKSCPMCRANSSHVSCIPNSVL